MTRKAAKMQGKMESGLFELGEVLGCIELFLPRSRAYL